MNELQKKLFEMQDVTYKKFHQKLIPTVSADAVIGVRVPILRNFARDFAKSGEAELFMQELPHTYYEENNLHAFLIEKIKNFEDALVQTERFLPYIDNWATCDMFQPKVFKKHPEEMLLYAREWIESERVYTVRYGVGLLMSNYLDEFFLPEQVEWIAAISSEEYYINMMCAWYFATALAKQYHAALPYLTEYRLKPWVHNKAIQKAIESKRIPDEIKQQLRQIKISNKRISDK